MTAIAFTPAELSTALSVAKEIGTAFGQARTAAGDTKKAVADALAMHETTVRYFEQGHFPNAKLGNALRLLAHYGLTLYVGPIVSRGTYEKHHSDTLNRAVRRVDCDPVFVGESP